MSNQSWDTNCGTPCSIMLTQMITRLWSASQTSLLFCNASFDSTRKPFWIWDPSRNPQTDQSFTIVPLSTSASWNNIWTSQNESFSKTRWGKFLKFALYNDFNWSPLNYILIHSQEFINRKFTTCLYSETEQLWAFRKQRLLHEKCNMAISWRLQLRFQLIPFVFLSIILINVSNILSLIAIVASNK